MGRPQFAQSGTRGAHESIAVNNRPQLERFIVTHDTTLPSGDTETVEVYAPSGSNYELVMLDLYVNAVTNASSGSHAMEFGYGGNALASRGASNYNKSVNWKYSGWQTADMLQDPSDEGAQALAVQQMRASESVGMQFTYENNADTAQENTRFYIGHLEEVSY